jgi:hypothetical protein
VLALALLAFVALPVASSDAAVSRKKAMWGPMYKDGKSQFPIYKDLGVGILEQAISWAGVAPTRPADATNPTDPAYKWSEELDRGAAEAKRNGMQLMLMLIGSPPWANGGKADPYAPTKPSDYRDFAVAAARHYPGVKLWMAWGEPCRSDRFQPQDPGRYARLVDAAYSGLKSVRRSNLVIGGNTFTTCGKKGVLGWIKGMRLPNGKVPRMDMYGHNPTSARRPDLSRPPLGRGYADFSDLDQLGGWLDRYLKAPNMKGRPLPLFLSEFLLPTDHFNYETNYYVTRKAQASWTTDALRIARRWKRIYTFGWFTLYDDVPNAAGNELTYGLLEADGKKKPAYAAFKAG